MIFSTDEQAVLVKRKKEIWKVVLFYVICPFSRVAVKA